jgi:hypothetical protein
MTYLELGIPICVPHMCFFYLQYPHEIPGSPLGGAKYDAPAEKGTGNPELLATQAYLEGGVNCGGPHVSGWISPFVVVPSNVGLGHVGIFHGS